jgi:hypothetical protein
MSDTLTYPDVVNWAVPLFIAAILAELLWIVIKGRGGRYETRDVLTSLLLWALSPMAFSWCCGRSRRSIWGIRSG